MWPFIILLWTIPAFFIASRASKQGRSYILFLLIGFFLGPVFGSIILLMVGDNKEALKKQNLTKKCPFCANENNRKALVCNSCGADLRGKEEKPQIGVRLSKSEFIVKKSTELKQGPDNNSNYVWSIEKNEIVRIRQTDGDWSFVVRQDNTGGWCLSSCLEEIKKENIKNSDANIKYEKIKDTVYEDSWVCGHCNMTNHIDMDNCSSCGKEFNPPL